MKIQKPGLIVPQLLYLGSKKICMYLLKGEAYALLGGGVPWVVPQLEAQLDEHRIDRQRIRYLVISHAHHDHCGAVPYLLRKYPHLKTISSPYAAYLLDKPKVVDTIRVVTHKTLDARRHPREFKGISLNYDTLSVDRVVEDGERLDLGGNISLEFIHTPGHSPCSLSTYVPQIQALFPADALPFPEDDKRPLTVTANHDYRDYIQSLEKLKRLVIQWVGYEHNGVLGGDDAAMIIPSSLAATLQQQQRIQDRYDVLQDLDQLIEETAEKFHRLELFSLVPSDTMRAITSRMVKSALGMK